MTGMLCLDTNTVIALIKDQSRTATSRFAAEIRLGSDIQISSIVLSELRYGVAKSKRIKRNRETLELFLSAPVAVLPFDAEDAKEAGEIRAHLVEQGTPLGPFDTLIAAQARRRGAVLVTNNRREFERVPGLMVTDWMQGGPPD